MYVYNFYLNIFVFYIYNFYLEKKKIIQYFQKNVN